MLGNVLRIAIHQGPLALWRAHYVKDKLITGHPGLVAELAPMVTRGDTVLDIPLVKVGGEGLSVKELEVALLENRVDTVVHSMKNVPVESPQGLGLVTICERKDPHDAFVFNSYDSLDALSAGSVVGTSSLRRWCQLAERRPNLIIRSLYGNVGTRLSKLDNDEYDAITLTTAGLERLGLESRIRTTLPSEISLPMVGQDTVGTECRLSDTRTRELLATPNYHETTLRVTTERAMNTHLEGGHQVPIGSYAKLTDGEIWLRVLIDAPDSSRITYGERRGTPQNAEQMGISLAEELLNNGMYEILAEIYNGDVPA